MSKVAKQGLHLAREAQDVTEKMEDGVYTAGAPQGGVQGGAQAVMFQRKFDARDPMDAEMNTRMQLMDGDGMTPFGQVFYDDKIGRWVERKAAVAEAANFDRYFAQNFNKNDLASRQFAQKINPEFYQQREREMNERAEMVVKLKGIQLRGPQSKEDLYMLWLIESGRVRLPKDWDRIAPGFAGDDNELKREKGAFNKENYARGLIRLPLFLSNKQMVERAAQNKAENAWGNPQQAPSFFPRGADAARNGPLQSGIGSAARLFLRDDLENAYSN